MTLVKKRKLSKQNLEIQAHSKSSRTEIIDMRICSHIGDSQTLDLKLRKSSTVMIKFNYANMSINPYVDIVLHAPIIPIRMELKVPQ